MTCDVASERVEGSTSRSSAAITSGTSRRNPVITTWLASPRAWTRRCTSSKPTPSPTITKRAAGTWRRTMSAASRKSLWPFDPRMLATSPMAGPLRPSSSRTVLPLTPGWNRVVSTPAGTETTRSSGTPAATTIVRIASPVVSTRSARRYTSARRRRIGIDTWRLRTTGRRVLRAASVASQLSTELCVWTMPISSWRISRRKVTAAATSKALRIVRLNTERSAAEASARKRLAGWHATTTSQPCSRSQRDSVRILISWPPSPSDDSVWSTTRRGDVDTRVSV